MSCEDEVDVGVDLADLVAIPARAMDATRLGKIARPATLAVGEVVASA
jgi:hypothetical protein